MRADIYGPTCTDNDDHERQTTLGTVDEQAKRWQLEMAQRIGIGVSRLRKGLRLSASALADRTRDLGYPISRGAIAKIESNSRGGKIDLAEVLILAKALKVPPLQLIYPDSFERQVEALPGIHTDEGLAVLWFSGEGGLPELDSPLLDEDETSERLPLVRSYYFMSGQISRELHALDELKQTSAPPSLIEATQMSLTRSVSYQTSLRAQLRDNGTPAQPSEHETEHPGE
ncbi:helix-turn-helix transcriptional regulator [Nocardia terpenica]|uniref:helix-turn-helix transcriptional regulator n=1 Tax=Nocardia terpenica TaxID=455432 RepID=UPI0018953B03|nr:helix-turn-helix transcriptional regulator [Nocardia terpenica]MBF6062490.1 helix-turn-helix transcriptional regulator [Nocardia terpenica]MBF6104578.1 helix-turn-helix transcriptional regulator [Nocardia terpenica]MBF6109567.1 helix-turn-helix transcriptional regulator [Nocardia terpenica]MBF6119872.1 helix-turn-helix transcriptional regulator [Nocardia terpenica]MBF6152283.1 helix-turn-helix transcriptional regulator [Nocardia terpenica]